MSDVNFVAGWSEATTQCRNCKSFQEHNAQTACVPEGHTFEQALAEFGACPADGHCDFFEAK